MTHAPVSDEQPGGVLDAIVIGAGFAGHVHGPPAARAGPVGARLRGRRGRGRHLVLEPVPGRAVRLGEHVLLVLVPARAGAGVAAGRALPGPAGDPALPRARRRSPGPEEGLHLQRPGDQRGLRRGGQPVDDHHRGRNPRDARPTWSRRSAACHGQQAGVPRRGPLRGPVAAHRGLAARAGGLHRPARRGHRHGRVRHPGHPGDRRAGRPPDGVPADGPVHHPGRQRSAGPAAGRAVEAELPRVAPPRPLLPGRHPVRGQRPVGARRVGAGAARRVRGGLGPGRVHVRPGHLLRPGPDRGSQPVRRGLRPVQDRRDRAGPGRGPDAQATASCSGPSGSRWTRTTTRRSTGRTWAWST